MPPYYSYFYTYFVCMCFGYCNCKYDFIHNLNLYINSYLKVVLYMLQPLYQSTSNYIK